MEAVVYKNLIWLSFAKIVGIAYFITPLSL